MQRTLVDAADPASVPLLGYSAMATATYRARLATLLAMLGVASCGRGLLPDLSFGSDGDETSTGTSVSSSTEPTASSESSPPSTSDSDDWGESAETNSSEVTSASSSESTGPGESSSESAETNSTDDPSAEGDGDGESEEWGDEWGTPPDVTNEPCDPLAQDCFPTHKCVPFASQPNSTFWDGNKCMPILGDKTWGEPCTLSSHNEAQDDCNGDGFCWNLEWNQGELHGTCVPFCVGSPQDLMCPPGWGCLFTGAIALCSKQCSPLIQDCPQAYGCYWTGGAFDCQITGTPATQGQACDMNNDCLPGFACVDKAAVPGCVGNDPNCCTQWCDLDAPDPCPNPLACTPFFDEGEAPAMFADVGVCISP